MPDLMPDLELYGFTVELIPGFSYTGRTDMGLEDQVQMLFDVLADRHLAAETIGYCIGGFKRAYLAAA